MTLENKYGKPAQDLGGGKFLTTDNKVRKLLSRCPACGTADILSGDSRFNICFNCERDWRSFFASKAYCFKEPVTVKKAKALIERTKNYCILAEQGYEVPTGVQQLYDNLLAYISDEEARLQEAEAARYKGMKIFLVECHRCGTQFDTYTYSKRYVCPRCSKSYERYKELRRQVLSLSAEQCVELRQLIHWYITQEWSPDTDSLLPRLKARETQLGM